MDRSELKARLVAENFNTDACGIGGPLPPCEGLILEQVNGQWKIEHLERGMRRELARFDWEEDACNHMYELLSKHFR
ncbi:MAG: hypothetical protein ACT4UP_10405 [Gammaproteobacteria bacterium]